MMPTGTLRECEPCGGLWRPVEHEHRRPLALVHCRPGLATCKACNAPRLESLLVEGRCARCRAIGEPDPASGGVG